MNNLAPSVMDNTFTRRVNNFNLRNFQELATERKKTFKCGLETVSYRCPQLCTLVLDTIKNASLLIQFKSKIKLWKCRECPWRLYKAYSQKYRFCLKNIMSLYKWYFLYLFRYIYHLYSTVLFYYVFIFYF